MVANRQYDYLDRLPQVSCVPQGANQLPWVHGYGLNAANQRTRLTLADSSYWVYQYDSLGQVTSGKRYWADGTPVAGEQFEYGFDDIGNRTLAKADGDQGGANLRSASFTNNTLNQVTGRAGEAGLDEGCGCCIIGVIKRWSIPATPPSWFDRLTGVGVGHGPSGDASISSVTGRFYKSPCEEVHDPGVWLDWSSTYESRKVPF
jgi:hypothetical protein